MLRTDCQVSVSFGARIPVIIVDIAVMVVTWVKLRRDAKEVSALRLRRSLSMALLRDGEFTFTAQIANKSSRQPCPGTVYFLYVVQVAAKQASLVRLIILQGTPDPQHVSAHFRRRGQSFLKMKFSYQSL